MDSILEKVFPYEGIPEIILCFLTPFEAYDKCSKEIKRTLEKKHKTINSGHFGGRQWTDTRFNGKLHSFNDEPARISKTVSNVLQEWYYLGMRHRDNDEPALLYQDGHKEWWTMDQITGWKLQSDERRFKLKKF